MGIFIINEIGAGFHFLLMAGNGQVIGTSGVYNSKVAAMVGVEIVKQVVSLAEIEDETVSGFMKIKDPKFVIEPVINGRVRWNLRSFDGQPILSSQVYLTVKNAKKGIVSVKKNGPIGTLEDLPVFLNRT